MVPNPFDPSPNPYFDDDSSITSPIAATPSETICSDDLPDDSNSNSNNTYNHGAKPIPASPAPADAPLLALPVPWPGATFIIRSVVCGRVITLREGRIELVSPPPRNESSQSYHHHPDVPGMHWDCVDNRGWLGFRNKVSGRFLGHDKTGKLCCVAQHQRGWENFVLRVRPQGGAVLYLAHWDQLRCVGVLGGLEVGQGGEKEEEDEQVVLGKMTEGPGVVWEFDRVGE